MRRAERRGRRFAVGCAGQMTWAKAVSRPSQHHCDSSKNYLVFRPLRGLPLVVSRWGESRTAVAPDFPFFQLAAQRHFFLGGWSKIVLTRLQIGALDYLESYRVGTSSVKEIPTGNPCEN